jgi:hypothetical protein
MIVNSLGDRLAQLEGSKWQRIAVAAKTLSANPRGLIYKLTNYPELYPEGLAWKWNSTHSIRFINVEQWRKAEESYFTEQKNRRESALAIANEARKSTKEMERDSAAQWKRLSVAAEELFCHPGTFTYQIKTYPHIYKEGKAWKWNRTKTRRLISVPGWRQADEKKALDKSKIKPNRSSK